ncbi:MAG: segregation/condensation protein A [Oscillospiraceae bacterium]|nr:segregation/condensation protein A [Oscillospiraceae bacterium]
MQELTYHIQDFEGPLDLLLHLIATHKMSLIDIRVNELIDQYLDFIGSVGPEELESASEFIEMAARLVYLKSIALLPREEEKEELTRELTGRLIEYSLCKEAAAKLRDISEGVNFFVREPMQIKFSSEYSRRHEPESIRKAFLSVQGKAPRETDLSRFEPIVSAPVVSVSSRVVSILGALRRKNGRHISDFFRNSTGRSETVATFLGILELIRDGRIEVADDGTVTTKQGREDSQSGQ